MASSSLDDWLAWQETCHVKEIDLGLERVSAVFGRLMGEKSVSAYSITVAGTNGKGSSVAMLESILIAAGYRVGVYSTPHLNEYNERIRFNGEPVEDQCITAAFSRINDAREGVSLSYFEFGTLAALDVFSEQAVDIQILEVGLGGRLDAVNIVDADAALITTIDIDHIAWLGNDLSSIAREKAGVFRANQKAVCADPGVPRSLIDYAGELKTDLLLAGEHYTSQLNNTGWRLLAEHSLAGEYAKPSLHGAHQIQNAAGVVSLLAHIADDIPVNKETINKGLQTVNLAGRLQQVASTPDIYLDVAHNAESALALLEFLKSKQYNELHVVFSMLEDKDLETSLQPFLSLVKHWHVAPLNTGRAQSIDTISSYLLQTTVSEFSCYESVESAFTGARNAVKKDDLLICFGSFFVVGACLDAL